MKIYTINSNNAVFQRQLAYQDKKGNVHKVGDTSPNREIAMVRNISNEKMGAAILVRPKKYPKLKILMKDGSSLKSKDGRFNVTLGDEPKLPVFRGTLYGSVSYDTEKPMKRAYYDFFKMGINNYPKMETKFGDYNFYTPTDGAGSRFKDYSALFNNIPKPAAPLPGDINGRPFRLIHATMANFAKTGMLDDVELVHVEKGGKGNVYSFMKGLTTGQIPMDKPIIFSWGDNFSDVDIKKMIKYHEKNNSAVTVMTVAMPKSALEALGTVELDPKKGYEIQGFIEKPKTEEDKMKSAIPSKPGYHMASVGPYILSPSALQQIVKMWEEDKESFLNANNEYDFTVGFLNPVAQKIKNSELKDSNGNPLKMFAYLKPDRENWSDLGKTSDLMTEMRKVKNNKYKGLNEDYRDSVKENVHRSGVITANEKSADEFRKFCREYGIEAKGNIIVSYA